MSATLPIVSAFVADVAAARSDAPPLAVVDAASISVERASAAQLESIDAEWEDLVARAHEGNAFMAPALARLCTDDCVTLLARSGGTLVGLWAFSIGHLGQSILPARTLRSPAFPHAYLATPVVDQALATEALAAMLDFIAQDGNLPKLIALDPIRSDGPTMQALEEVLAARGSRLCVLSESKRPVLESSLDAKQYFEQAMSSSSRKKLRQHRRRLAEKAPLESRVFADAADITRAFEDFLTLEAAGWKGGRGTALLCSQRDVAFGRAMIASLAARGNASIHALYQNGKPVASQIVLRAGATAFTWKTAYDESLGDFSPGMLLLEDYTAAFLADKSIVRVDSCAFDDSGFMSAWREREQIAHVLLEARPGGSLSLHFIAALQRGALALRAIAKKVYLLGRRHWTGH